MGLVSSEHRDVSAWAAIKTCYAVDVAGDHVSVLRAQRSGAAIRTRVVFDGNPASESEAWEIALTAMQAEVVMGTAWIAGVLPAHSTLVKTVEAPFESKSKASKVLPSLLDIRLPFPLEQCHYAFPDMHTLPDGQVRALAVAARFEEVESHQASCKHFKLEASLLDHEGLAIWSYEQSRRVGPQVVAWLGPDRMCIALGTDQQLEQVHALRIGARHLSENGPDELVKRIKRIWKTLPETWSEQPVNWTISGALSPAESTLLETALNEFSQAQLTRKEPFLLQQVATRALKAGPLHCNFLSGDHLSPALEKGLALRNRKTMGFFFACGLLLCALAWGWNLHLESRQHRLQASIDEVFQELTLMPNTQRGMEPIIARRALDDQLKSMQPFLGMFEPSPAARMDAILRYCFTQGIRLDTFELGSDRILCEGRAESRDEIKALKELVEQQHFEVLVEQQPPAPDVAFTLTGKGLSL